jgi:dTDP-4-dehydrorhamnose reductase
MRILVTGMTGQVGRALVARLPRLPGGAAIIAADRAVLDLSQPQAIAATLDRLAPALIVNAAAYTAVDRAEDDELRIVADQIGAPTSAALIADAVTEILSAGAENLRRRFVEAGGLVHLAASGETSWHGFACAIVVGLKERGVPLAVQRVTPIGTDDYPARSKRPRNSRLDLTRLKRIFGVTPPDWRSGLPAELDQIARERLSFQSST